MRQSMTIRLDPSVIEAAKGRAQTENRTLTNYIETVLRRDLGLLAAAALPESPRASEAATAAQQAPVRDTGQARKRPNPRVKATR
jgi:hypothetical protein